MIVFVLLMSGLTINGQTISNEDIKTYSKKLNNEIKGLVIDPSTGVKGRGVISVGRKLIYQYDVPEDWYPFEDIKQVLVKNLIEDGNEKMYVNFKLDLGYYYYKNDKVIKTLSIDWEEFNTFRFTYGDYINLTNHPKSNGLEFKLKRPLGWEVKEGNGPHIIKKFTSDKKVYMIYVKETGQFLTKKEVIEFFENETERGKFINEFGKVGGFDFKTNKVVTIERHPFIYTTGTIQQERMGVEMKGKVHLWMSLIEDQFIYFMGSSYSEEDFYMDFFKITNSLKLLNQY